MRELVVIGVPFALLAAKALVRSADHTNDQVQAARRLCFFDIPWNAAGNVKEGQVYLAQRDRRSRQVVRGGGCWVAVA
ncbi:hypothetical protein [Kitasatospora herbaricolor]|uniref:hypothetical protein n=1 Tax=Kitasatospora herbaricolor TaxID=68217 RepID=UPI0036DCBA4F